MAADDCFDIDVAIRRVEDGVIRICRHEYGSRDENGEFNDYIWSEGNYGCDCNRALFHARAVGEDDPDRECGETAFVIDWIKDAATGCVLYSED